MLITKEKIFVRGDSFFNALINDLNNAQYSIELESYIFNQDLIGNRVIKALTEAAQRGVKVRVLIDGIGCAEEGKNIASILEEQQIAVKIYHPLPWQVDRYHWAVQQGTVFGRLFHFIQKINKRNHRKLCIIDNSHVWTGSMNISTNHLSINEGGDGWHDIGVCISGNMLPPIRATFESLWQKNLLTLWNKPFTQFVSNISPKMRYKKNRFLIEKIRTASKRIWITSAYFSPSAGVLRALRHATVNNEVDVRLIVPSKSDVPFFPLLTASYYADLLKMGVTIYEYTPAFLHAKALIIDNLCIVGSSNLNHRSLLHDLELDVILTQPTSLHNLQRQFIKDMHQSKQITTKHLRLRAWYLSVSWIPRLLRYWL